MAHKENYMPNLGWFRGHHTIFIETRASRIFPKLQGWFGMVWEMFFIKSGTDRANSQATVGMELMRSLLDSSEDRLHFYVPDHLFCGQFSELGCVCWVRAMCAT